MQIRKQAIGIFLGVICVVLAVVWLWMPRIKEKKELKIGVSLYSESDTFVDSIVSSMQEQAAAYEAETGCPVTLNISRANGSQREQYDQVEQYVALGYDAVCVNLVDRTNASSMVDLAQSEEVPLVFFNREPVREDILRGENVYYVGTDARETARMQGEAVLQSYAASAEKMDKNGDGILQYVMLEGEMGHQDTILRSDYVLQTIEDGGVKLQKLDAETADWMRSRADAIMEQWIAEMGDEIELVLCNNDDMALGAADALQRTNFTAAVFGIDGTPAGLAALEQKVIWATVDCGAKEQGKAVFNIASALGMGREVPEDMQWSDGRYVRVPVQVRIHESII